MMFVLGLPMFFLEVALGQYAGVGPAKLFKRLNPAFRGIGIVSMMLTKQMSKSEYSNYYI